MIPPHSLRGIRLLIFDLDGTLVDSERDLAESVNAVRSQMGLAPLARVQVASYVGRGVTVLIERALDEGASEADVQNGVALFLDHYHIHMLDHTLPYPGVREALEELSDRTLAVLTNKPVRFSRDLLVGLGLDRYFAYIYGGNSFEQKKPDPAGVVKLLQDTSIEPRATLIVGDSDTDVLTGRNASVWTCGVTYGLGSETLGTTIPDLLVGDLRDLARLLKEP